MHFERDRRKILPKSLYGLFRMMDVFVIATKNSGRCQS